MQHPLYATYLINQSFNSDFKVVLNSVPSFARSYGNIMDVKQVNLKLNHMMATISLA